MQLRFSVSLSLGHDHDMSALVTPAASTATAILQYRTVLERRRRRHVGPLAPFALLVPGPTDERGRKCGYGHHGHKRQVVTAHQSAAASATHRAMRLVVLLRFDQLTEVADAVVVWCRAPRCLLNHPTGTVGIPWIVLGECHQVGAPPCRAPARPSHD